MCKRPHTLETGEKIACRNCNDCVNTRSNEWIARAMAEKLTSRETYSITLTYNDDTLENSDGARFFRYSDVNAFIKRLKRAATYKFGKVDNAIRFICAGEIGSKGTERCHWHIVIYSQIDLLSLGDFHNFHTGKEVTSRHDKITTDPNRVKRLNWQYWPHGFLSIQEPDQGGIAYALIYALKDQFSLEKSKGTMRQHRSENFASGYFRMSKRPPIGGLWLDQKLDRLLELGAVLPNLKLNVPEYSGYWYPSGTMRQKLLRGLYLINQIQVEQTGNNAPQWASLLATIDPETKDYEVLTHGEIQETDEQTDEEWQLSQALRSKEYDQRKNHRDTRRRCGGIRPCSACANSLTDDQTDALSKEIWTRTREILASEGYRRKQAQLTRQQLDRQRNLGDVDRAEKYHRETTLRPATYCGLAGLASVRKAFR